MGWLKLVIKAVGKAFVKIGIKKSIGPAQRLVDVVDVVTDFTSGNVVGAIVGVVATTVDVATYGVIGDMDTIARTVGEELGGTVSGELLKESAKDTLSVSTANIVARSASELVRNV